MLCSTKKRRLKVSKRHTNSSFNNIVRRTEKKSKIRILIFTYTTPCLFLFGLYFKWKKKNLKHFNNEWVRLYHSASLRRIKYKYYLSINKATEKILIVLLNTYCVLYFPTSSVWSLTGYFLQHWYNF